ncbi:MAG: hypothetical protein ACR2LS_00935, partial [Thermomicrobiales bacterium]
MTLAHITPLLQSGPLFRQIATRRTTHDTVSIAGVPASARPALLAALAAGATAPALIIVPREDRAERMASALREWVSPATEVLRWPAPEALPYEQLPFDRWEAAHRIAVLDRLRRTDAPSRPIVVASAAALTRRVMSPNDLETNTTRLTIGQRFDPADLQRWL